MAKVRGMATVTITPEAAEQLEGLPTEIHRRVLLVFTRLASWPHVSGAKPLSGKLAGQYRVRTGDYRVQFTATSRARDAVVTVLKIGHRDGFYA